MQPVLLMLAAALTPALALATPRLCLFLYKYSTEHYYSTVQHSTVQYLVTQVV